MLDHTGFELGAEVMQSELGEQMVDVVVSNAKAGKIFEKRYTFCLVRRSFGTKKGCLMTSRIIKHEVE